MPDLENSKMTPKENPSSTQVTNHGDQRKDLKNQDIRRIFRAPKEETDLKNTDQCHHS